MSTARVLDPYVRAMTLPVWTDGPAVPEDVELRRSADLAAIVLRGTRAAIGFVPSRVEDLVPLIERLRAQGE
jgi:hypothetical protein